MQNALTTSSAFTLPSYSSPAEGETSINPLLPLRGYHEYQYNKITLKALPIYILDTKIYALPPELVEKIHAHLSLKDLQNLTSVNRAAFITRFYNPRLQALKFTAQEDIELFLSYCGDSPTAEVEEFPAEDQQRSNKRLKSMAQDAPRPHGVTRSQEQLHAIKTLKFNFPLNKKYQLVAEQCERLFKYLVGVECIEIADSYPETPFTYLNLQTLLKPASHLHSLQHLDIVGLSCFPLIDKELGQLEELRSLKLTKPKSSMILPESIKSFSKLEKLALENVGDTKQLESIGQLNTLKWLILEDMPLLQKLPSTLGDLNKLETLELKNLPKLKKISVLNDQFKNLKVLELRLGYECDEDKRVFIDLSNISNLSKLEKLFLADMAIDKLPADIGRLKALKSITLYSIDNLSLLPNSIRGLTALEKLKLHIVNNLKELPGTIGQLKNSLKSITLYRLDELSSLPNSIGDLTALEKLRLSEVNNLKELPDTIGQLKNLKKFLINSGDNAIPISALPEIGNLTSLEWLELEGLNLLEEIPAAIGQLKNLKKLSLVYLDRITLLPREIKNLVNLEKLEMIKLRKLEKIPKTVGQFKKLKLLRLIRNDAITVLPREIGDLANLEKLEISDSEKIEEIPETIGQLKKLKSLTIVRLDMLSALPTAIGDLVNLEKLKIAGLKRLETIPETIGQLKKLKLLMLFKLNMLSDLPDEIGSLINLEELEISNLERLEVLPETIGQLKKLKLITIDTLDLLLALPPELRSLVNAYSVRKIINSIPDGDATPGLFL
jgi:Leucine-rich repeat (LRR) protein